MPPLPKLGMPAVPARPRVAITLDGWLAKRLAIAAVALGLALGGWLLFRSNPQVRDVTIVGLSREAQPAVVSALEDAARAQSVGGFSVARLRQAVAQYTLVAGISATTEGSSGVSITIRERPTALRLAVGGAALPLDASGAVITGLAHAPAHIATVRSAHLPVHGRTTDPFVLTALRVLGAAPAPLRSRVVALTAPRGLLTVYLHRGPRLIFGDDTLPHAKWDAAAAVLASRWSAGASYIDVRIPSRAAAQVGDPNTTLTSAAGGSSGATAGGLTNAATALGPGSF